jgi:hypothetical protein
MTYSTSLQKRPLILPHEVREMRRDEQIIFVAAKPALRCGRAIFFRRPEMMEGLGKSKLREGAVAHAPAQTMPERAAGDAALSAAFDALDSTSLDASSDDGAAATGFEGQSFEDPDVQLEPTQTEPTQASAAAADAVATEDAAHRADADLSFGIEPTEIPTVDLLADVDALFTHRPLRRHPS